MALVFTAITLGLIGISYGGPRTSLMSYQGSLYWYWRSLRLVTSSKVHPPPLLLWMFLQVEYSKVGRHTVGISNSDAGSSKNLLSIVRKIYKIPNNFAIVMFSKINLNAIN